MNVERAPGTGRDIENEWGRWEQQLGSAEKKKAALQAPSAVASAAAPMVPERTASAATGSWSGALRGWVKEGARWARDNPEKVRELVQCANNVVRGEQQQIGFEQMLTLPEAEQVLQLEHVPC